MTRDGHNHRLSHLALAVKVADLFGFLEAVHNGHAYVGQYQAVDMRALFEAIFDLVVGFEAVVGPIHQFGQSLDANLVDHQLQPKYVVGLVVHDQDALGSWFLWDRLLIYNAFL